MVARIFSEATLSVEPTPERGRTSLQQRLADVLIIDPSPHELATVRLIEWLKSAHPETYVIVLSSDTTPALRRRFQALPIDLYQEKTGSPIALAHQLRGILHKLTQPLPEIVD
jgi:DNA-binding NarL/FixJ family response regulator